MGRTAELDRRIQAGPTHFPVLVRCGEQSWTELAELIAGLRAHRFLLVTDAATPAAALARVRALASAQAPCTVHAVPAGAPAGPAAGSDSGTGALPGAGWAPEGRTVVIALGGEQACGVTADVRLPTTLAAACGPALALPRPVPAPGGAPPAGALPGPGRAPTLVWIRSDVLAGRPAVENRAGLVEVIRHVLAVCPAQYEVLARMLRPRARHTARTVAACVVLCADARAALVCFDPFETGPALALGYGRSLGAALRSVPPTTSALAPGDAGALGLLLAARIAVLGGLLDRSAECAHRELLARNGSATALPAGAAARTSAAALAAVAEPGLVLLDGLGHPHCRGGRLLTRVDAALLRSAVEGLARTVVPHSRGPAPDPRPVTTE